MNEVTMPEEAFRILLKMHVRPGLEADFEKAWLAVGNVITEHPANLGQWLMRATDESSVYYIISDWVDEPQFRRFELSDAHVAHRRQLHPFRSGGSMATMQVLHGFPGRAGAR
ncbi:antibiotic biosynthesis monooxygenase family protein [Actinoplanes sp. NPDC048791]|jgi:heme-degrading monooxygenase HmoA|uniref:antibiotic biosynthesis monooxygenase family protein n=1 Tax=Actinoplanes sp. NPDC048791 TaxID=3154623 RepID=UPI0033D21793